MQIDEIFSQLIAHMREGIIMHDEMSIIYNFLNLEGYQQWHEHQFVDESANYKAIQNYYLTYYRKIIPEIPIKKSSLIVTNWYKHTKENIDTTTKKSIIRDLMKKWVEWEISTCDILQKSYIELQHLGEINSAEKLISFLNKTEKELKSARAEYLNLETLGYDIVHIIEKQHILYKKYK